MKALIVGLDEEARRSVPLTLRAADVFFFDAADLAQALTALARDWFDVIFVVERPDALDAVGRLSRNSGGADAIVLASQPSLGAAVAAIRAGARDYVPLAHFADRLPVLLQDLRSRISPREAALQTTDAILRRALDTAFRAAASDVPILIQGERGVGKSLLACALHAASRRSGGPFVVLQCPVAAPGRLGAKLSAAAGGTLVLDDVGELPTAVQAELLAVLLSEPDGKLPARLIATTKQDLFAPTVQFRAELLGRLNVVEVMLHPLRDRPGDVLPLAEHYLRAYTERYRVPIDAFSAEAQDCLRNYSWPGNLRELSNTVERVVAVGNGPTVALEDLPTTLVNGPAGPTVELGGEFSLKEMEAEHIRRVLKRAPTMERASRILGVDQSTLWRKRKLLKL